MSDAAVCDHIALRYAEGMKPEITEADYGALAELRYRIRQFVHGSDAAAEAAGLEPQQYQLLLALRGLPRQTQATIGCLAERLSLKHHSAVGLVDRLEEHGYVRRQRSGRDQRQVVVSLLPRGQRALENVVRARLHELREGGHALVDALTAILKDTASAGRAGLRTISKQQTKVRRKVLSSS